MELYFYTFVVAILIFAIGAGVSLYEGFHKLTAPREIRHIHINYIVLGAAMIFEGFAWTVAFKEFRKRKGKLGYFKAVQLSKDPTVFTVLFEDSAAMLGLIVAFIGLLLTQFLDAPMFDALASIDALGDEAQPKAVADRLLVTRANVSGLLRRLDTAFVKRQTDPF